MNEDTKTPGHWEYARQRVEVPTGRVRTWSTSRSLEEARDECPAPHSYPHLVRRWVSDWEELDTSSSASRQHYIDTGEYLPVETKLKLVVDLGTSLDYDVEHPGLTDREWGDLLSAIVTSRAMGARVVTTQLSPSGRAFKATRRKVGTVGAVYDVEEL